MRAHGQKEAVALASLADRIIDTLALLCLAALAAVVILGSLDLHTKNALVLTLILWPLGAIGVVTAVRVIPVDRLSE